MIQSMTGFGRAEHETAHYQVKIEMHSVNRKNCEVILQLPKPLLELEAELRKIILSSVHRGRVQVNLTIAPCNSETAGATVDAVKLKAIVKACEEISQVTGNKMELQFNDLVKLGGVVSIEEQGYNMEQVREALFPAFALSLDRLIQMRQSEGKHMVEDIAARIDFLEKEITALEQRAPVVVENYREALHKRLKESGIELDLEDDRLIKEIGIYAERCDVSEEMARLSSHFSKFREYLFKSEPVGRSLDFLCQEMNRELNTVGSKANDSTIAQAIVTCKTELEKVREQVQNIA